jgi:CubicO group peptidase (beta-lactamase class C family)
MSAEVFVKIDTSIQNQMKRLHIPGACLAVIEGDHIVHLRGFGRARPDGEAPGAQTPFFIGSLTKSFTALAVMQLVEAGKVRLDEPVQHYLAWFHVADPQASAQISVRHLLNQTSGLPSLPGELVLTNFDERPDATERQARQLARLKISHRVGEHCEYSNLNYNLLGLVIEAASGKSYPEYIQENIFTPLEMGHSYTSKAEAKANGLAMGYRHWFSMPFPAPNLRVPRGSLPSGQLISCAEDMAHFLTAHLNQGRYGQTQILSAEGMDTLHRGVKEYIAFGISSGSYGMGWFEINMEGTKIHAHGGNVPDFSAFMSLIPERKSGLILLLNADPYGLPPITMEVGMSLTATLARQQPRKSKLDFIQWIMRLLPFIPILQGTCAIATMRKIHRWRTSPTQQPKGKHLWSREIALPLVPNVSLVAGLAALRRSGLLGFFNLFMPDLAWTARISGIFAAIWSILRTLLILRALRKPSSH